MITTTIIIKIILVYWKNQVTLLECYFLNRGNEAGRMESSVHWSWWSLFCGPGPLVHSLSQCITGLASSFPRWRLRTLYILGTAVSARIKKWLSSQDPSHSQVLIFKIQLPCRLKEVWKPMYIADPFLSWHLKFFITNLNIYKG